MMMDRYQAPAAPYSQTEREDDYYRAGYTLGWNTRDAAAAADELVSLCTRLAEAERERDRLRDKYEPPHAPRYFSTRATRGHIEDVYCRCGWHHAAMSRAEVMEAHREHVAAAAAPVQGTDEGAAPAVGPQPGLDEYGADPQQVARWRAVWGTAPAVVSQPEPPEDRTKWRLRS